MRAYDYELMRNGEAFQKRLTEAIETINKLVTEKANASDEDSHTIPSEARELLIQILKINPDGRPSAEEILQNPWLQSHDIYGRVGPNGTLTPVRTDFSHLSQSPGTPLSPGTPGTPDRVFSPGMESVGSPGSYPSPMPPSSPDATKTPRGLRKERCRLDVSEGAGTQLPPISVATPVVRGKPLDNLTIWCVGTDEFKCLTLPRLAGPRKLFNKVIVLLTSGVTEL